MKENIVLRPACIADASQIARLIMTAMTDECCLFFCGGKGDINDFYRLMCSLVEREDTQYSYLNTICAEDTATGKVCGISTSYDGGKLNELRKPFFDRAMQAWGIDHSGIGDETQPGELYLDSLAVVSEYRGNGIASALLRATKEKAVKMNLPLGLLVDCGNPKAEALYTKIGFRYVDKNSWGGHDMKHLQW